MIKPHHTLRYVSNRIKQIIFERMNPSAPWLVRHSIPYIEKLLRPDDFCVEFGSGRSTLWLAGLCDHLISVEHDKSWFDKVSQNLINYPNVEYCLKNLNNNEPVNSEYVKSLYSLSTNSVDVILNDGKYRDWIALGCLDKLKTGGLFILDNAERYLANDFSVPASIGKNEEHMTNEWKRFNQLTCGWRRLWFSDGVSTTLLLLKT